MSAHFTAAPLASRALIRISGLDWRAFLQGLLTQDVETLQAGEMRYAGLLTPQGRLLYDLFLIGDDEDGLIDVAAEHRAALIARLTIYRLRAQVELTPIDEAVMALWSSGAEASAPTGWLRDPRLSALGWRGRNAPPAAANLADEAAYDAHRLALCIPDPLHDAPPETTYPIEANFDLLNGIDFKKGCFVGQETTSRMKRRGPIKTRMLGLEFDGRPPAFGAEVLAGALRAGEVRSSRDGRAMALLRLDRIEGGALTVEGRPVKLARPAYLPATDV